jgi:hypothetical protein
MGLTEICDNVLREWAQGFPLYLEGPRFGLRGGACRIPLMGMLMDSDTPCLTQMVQDGLEEGIRHFALALNSNERMDDAKFVETVGRLLCLKVGELLHRMKAKHMNYLQRATLFTIVTRPQYINCFKSVQKALASCGYRVTCWFLDVRNVNPDKPMSKQGAMKLLECWEIMNAARKAGEVESIGLKGNIGNILSTMDVLRQPLCAIILDSYPGKVEDPSRQIKFNKLMVSDYGSPQLLTWNVLGPQNMMLKSRTVKMVADDLDVDVHTLLFKWAEAQGMGVLAPSLRDNQREWQDKSESNELPPKYHRSLMRLYDSAPSASHCAVSLENEMYDRADAGSRAGSRMASRANSPDNNAGGRRGSVDSVSGTGRRRSSSKASVSGNNRSSSKASTTSFADIPLGRSGRSGSKQATGGRSASRQGRRASEPVLPNIAPENRKNFQKTASGEFRDIPDSLPWGMQADESEEGAEQRRARNLQPLQPTPPAKPRTLGLNPSRKYQPNGLQSPSGLQAITSGMLFASETRAFNHPEGLDEEEEEMLWGE